MTVVSKALYKTRMPFGVKCTNFHFWTENCWKANADFVAIAFVGSVKYFIPIYIVSFIINNHY